MFSVNRTFVEMPRPTKAMKRSLNASAMTAKRLKYDVKDPFDEDDTEFSDLDDESGSECIIVGGNAVDEDDHGQEIDAVDLMWVDSALEKFRAVQTGGSIANVNKKKAALRNAALGKPSFKIPLTNYYCRD
jgi:hypothetical protein